MAVQAASSILAVEGPCSNGSFHGVEATFQAPADDKTAAEPATPLDDKFALPVGAVPPQVPSTNRLRRPRSRQGEAAKRR